MTNPITTGGLVIAAIIGIFYIVGMVRSMTPKYKR
jgi:hypothetical protein